MTIAEKLEKKIDLTQEELKNIVYRKCTEVEQLINEINDQDSWFQYMTTYFKLKNSKWYKLNWDRGIEKNLKNAFLDQQPIEVKKEIKKVIIWTPVE